MKLRPGGPRADGMQRVRHQRLAGARFAHDQDMAIGLTPDRGYPRAVGSITGEGSDQLAHQSRCRPLNSRAQRPVVQRQAPLLAGAFWQGRSSGGVERLFQEVIGAQPHPASTAMGTSHDR